MLLFLTHMTERTNEEDLARHMASLLCEVSEAISLIHTCKPLPAALEPYRDILAAIECDHATLRLYVDSNDDIYMNIE